jgi:hypothetical protein
MLNGKYNPYQSPTPYEVLGLKQGVAATAREIGKAISDQQKKARRIKDLKERAERLKEIDEAKARLLRPDDRVQIDFFILGNRIFADLCCSFGRKLIDGELNTSKIIGPLYPASKYDNLIPEPLEKLSGEFHLVDSPEFYDDPADRGRLPLAQVDL